MQTQERISRSHEVSVNLGLHAVRDKSSCSATKIADLYHQ